MPNRGGEMKVFDIWNYDEQMAIEQYHKDNFSIRTYPTGGEYCVIFCSSNNIWFPNTEEAFRESVIEKDRYEWTNFHFPNAGKEIFIRDIYKSWYVSGINERIDTIDHLVDFLRKEAEGYKIILVGSSAGGYLASLLGALLKAEYVIAFSAQFELRNKWARDVNPLLRKFEEDDDRNKYYDLVPVLKESNVPVYYIVPIKSEQDHYHFNHVKDLSCIKPIVFNSRHHGIVMLKGNLNRFFLLSQEELQVLFENNRGRIISSIGFSLQLEGIAGTLSVLANQMVLYWKMIQNKISQYGN